MRWSLRFHVARAAHTIVNRLAWRFACPPGPEWGRTLRIDKRHPLWRLNDWVAGYWTQEYLEAAMERSRRYGLRNEG